MALLRGTVVMTESSAARRGANGVGIRVDDDGGSRVLWPSYLAAHLEPPDPTEPCWRCEEIAAAGGP